MSNVDSDIYNQLLHYYELQHTHFLDVTSKHFKHNFCDLFLDKYHCDNLFMKPYDKELTYSLVSNRWKTTSHTTIRGWSKSNEICNEVCNESEEMRVGNKGK